MTGPDPMTAALLQLAGLAQQLADLDQREAADIRGLRAQVATLISLASGMNDPLTGQAQPDLGQADTEEGIEPSGYQPVAAPRFWQLTDAEREHTIDRLRAWVSEIYRPEYGHLSAGMGDCWDQHPMCLYLLDWLSELWSVLYLQPARTPGQLAGQAEWQTRILPAAADQLARETRLCQHAATRSRIPAARTVRP